MTCVLHVCGKTGERPVLRRGGCTINCNLDNHVPSAAVTKCARDGQSSVSRRRIATQEADNDTDEILKVGRIHEGEKLRKDIHQE